MCGPAGCGKSTFVKRNSNPKTDVIVSRDAIRFDLLEERGGDYFSYEDEVWRKFVSFINLAGANANVETVWVDATHLTPKSRKKLLNAIDTSYYKEIWAIALNCSLQGCLIKNSNREGLAQVPEAVIKNHYTRYILPTLDEGFDKIVIIEMEAFQ